MGSFPPACPLCKGSRQILELSPVFDELPPLPSIAKMLPGVGYISPRPMCPKCNGMGTLREEEGVGEYPPPPVNGFDTETKPASISLSPDQQAAVDEILHWFSSTTKKRKSLAGFAGTGKTTIVGELLRRLKGHSIRVCAPTGKAASVLRHKGVDACTLHKLVYVPSTFCIRCEKTVQIVKGFDKKVRCPECKGSSIKTKWMRVPIIDADLVIVDEASMLNQSMVDDIESLTQKILYVGDHGQLEPIGADPRIMREPDIRLENIHRQAEHSGIIQLAHHVRVGSHPANWDGDHFEDARVCGITKLIPRVLDRFDVVLCGYNKTRKAINSAIRGFRGFADRLPELGERLICLQNDSDLGIFNGLLVTVIGKRPSYEYPRYDFLDDAGNEYLDITIHPDQFEEEKRLEFINKGIGLFDFGYCLTCHKSQGSEFDKVAVIEQIARAWDPARWRYTAITRAAKQIEYWMPMGRL